MKGVRGLVGGVLVLALVCAMPAISLAQNGGPPDTTTTATTPDPAPQPAPEPAPQPVDSGGSGSAAPSTSPGASPPGPVAGTQREAVNDPGDTTSRDASVDGSSGGASKDSSPKAHKSASTTVNMEDFFFSPATVTVSVGDLVTWRNRGQEPHTATADDGSFDTGTVPAGSSGSHMFTKPGTFSYICTIHPNMKGTVRVVSSGGGGSGGASSSGSGQTEAQAVNSQNAAGDANTLPATGMAAGGLALVGLALLGSGLAVRRSTRRLAGQQLSLF